MSIFNISSIDSISGKNYNKIGPVLVAKSPFFN